MAAPGKLGIKSLTAELRKLAVEAHTVKDDGTPVTREAALADMIWKLALGWTETTRDENGNLKTVVHPPVAWAMQYCFERLEGKAPISATENEGGVRAADRVRQLAKDRLNQIAATLVVGKPPKHVPKTA